MNSTKNIIKHTKDYQGEDLVACARDLVAMCQYICISSSLL